MCAVFAVVVCGMVFHFAPGSAKVLFNLGPVNVTGSMMIFVCSLWGGYRLTGK